MNSRSVLTLAILVFLSLSATVTTAAPSNAAGEYAKYFAALSSLSVAVVNAMPPDQYGFRPHPDSMDFGQLMSHIATTNYQFCAGLEDSQPPALPSPTGKAAVVKFLSDSFEYCTGVISNHRRRTRRLAQLPRRPSSWPRSPPRHVRSRGPSSRPSRNLPPRQRHQAAFLPNLTHRPEKQCANGRAGILCRQRQHTLQIHKVAVILGLLLTPFVAAEEQAPAAQSDLRTEIQQTYNFQPHTLNHQKLLEKSKTLDQFWANATSQRDVYTAGLRHELADFSNPPFFPF